MSFTRPMHHPVPAVAHFCHRELWRGRKFETAIHRLFAGVWIALTAFFTLCAARQSGWLE